MTTRKPPEFPEPLRAIRCLMTPPPKSASINPRLAFRTVAQRSESSISFLRANRAKGLLMKTLGCLSSFVLAEPSVTLSAIPALWLLDSRTT